ncbi:hypothetical protein [Arthrobacter castelli]|uniref:hypothetical protein n=1 Tax=Arthrobacter castelli TaxID=271431 RepID=UPI0003F4EB00|nr:hypothetical protein [Arthrobacter castelli]
MHQPKSVDLRARLRAVIDDKKHQAIVFPNLDEVRVGSVGYFTPGGIDARRLSSGWIADGPDRHAYRPGPEQIFTSLSGPANDEKLISMLEADLMPEHHILVNFEAVTDSEIMDGPYGSGGDGVATWTSLFEPKLLGHNLNDNELAGLYFEIEAVGSLSESDAYHDLDKLIEKIGESPAEALRSRINNPDPGLLEPAPDTNETKNRN